MSMEARRALVDEALKERAEERERGLVVRAGGKGNREVKDWLQWKRWRGIGTVANHVRE